MPNLRFEYVLHEKSYWIFTELASTYPLISLKEDLKYWFILLVFGYKKVYLLKGNLPRTVIPGQTYKLRVWSYLGSPPRPQNRPS